MSGSGCFVRRANPLTTDLNISIRSENLSVLCDCRSKTLNITDIPLCLHWILQVQVVQEARMRMAMTSKALISVCSQRQSYMWKAEMRLSLKNRRNQERVSKGELFLLRKGAQMLRIYARDQWSSCLISVQTGLSRSRVILSYGVELGSSSWSVARLRMFPIRKNAMNYRIFGLVNTIIMIKDINKLLKRSLSFNQRTIPLNHSSSISEKDFYVIQCHSNSFCLREELKCYKLQENDSLRVIGGELDPNDPNILSYLWLFTHNQKENSYAIIHARTDLSLSSDDFQCELEHGNLAQKQSFNIQEVKSGIFRIRDHNENFLTLDGILQPNEYMERDPNQEFSLKKIKEQDVQALKGTGFILCSDKSKAIDLTNASRKNQNEIILYPPNCRMNQRWLFEGIEPEKEEHYLRQSIDRTQRGNRHKIYIRSALTEQFMSYNRQHHQLMQSSYPEEWRLQPLLGGMSEQNNGQFHIEHVKQHKYLSYRADTFELRLSSQPCVWIIPNHEWALSYAYHKEMRVKHHLSI